MKFSKVQEFSAEFLGTMVLILFGCGSVAMVVLFGSNPAIPGEVVKGGYTNIVIGWGLAVTMGIYIAGTISGAHLNPAVTISLACTGRFPWSKCLHYIIAQFAGAFAGAALVFGVFYAKWMQVDPVLGVNHTAGIFCTFGAVPAFFPGFFDQVVGTALLLGMILAVGDKFNAPPGANLAPLMVGLIVVAIGISFGGMYGYAINPARDLGPRSVCGGDGLQEQRPDQTVPPEPSINTMAWLPPVIGPLVGGVLGTLAYDLLIGRTR